MIRQRNKFLTFIFSLIPGCGHMYMGFMKRGVSMLGLLFAIIFLSVLFMDLIALLIFILWFYCFFEAINLMSLAPEAFAQTRDSYLFSDDNAGRFFQKHKRPLGIALILLGVGALFVQLSNTLLDGVYFLIGDAAYQTLYSIIHYIPGVAASVLIIWLGIRLIRRGKRVLTQNDMEMNDV